MQPMEIQHIMPKFHTCWQTQRPTFGWPCNEQTPPNLFFDFLKETGKLKKISPSLKPTGPHIKRKIRIHLISSFYSFKAIRTIKNSLPPSNLQVQHQKKEKFSTLLSLSHLRVQHLGKGNPFMQEYFYFYFPSRTRNLVRVLATLILESMISSKNF